MNLYFSRPQFVRQPSLQVGQRARQISRMPPVYLGLRRRRVRLRMVRRAAIPFSCAQNTREPAGNLTVLQSIAHRIRDHLRAPPVTLARGEHHYEKSEQEGDEVGIRDQPAIVVLVVRRAIAREFHSPAATDL